MEELTHQNEALRTDMRRVLNTVEGLVQAIQGLGLNDGNILVKIPVIMRKLNAKDGLGGMIEDIGVIYNEMKAKYGND